MPFSGSTVLDVTVPAPYPGGIDLRLAVSHGPETGIIPLRDAIAWPQEVTKCPNCETAGTQRDDGDQVLQAVKFTDKKVPGLHLDLDEDFKLQGASRKFFVDGRWGC